MLPSLIALCFAVMVYRACAVVYTIRSGARLRPSWLEVTWPLIAAGWFAADGALLAGWNGWTAAFVTIVIPSAFAGAVFTATTAMVLAARAGGGNGRG